MRYRIKQVLAFFYRLLNGAYLSGRLEDQIREGRVVMGRYSYGVPQVHSWPDDAKLLIGNFTSIADEVHILLGGDHPTNWVSTFPFRVRMALPGAWQDGMPSSKGNVWIGSDVWIGHGVTILSGVSIGNGSIIVSRSVVNKDVEPYTIAGGIPCKPLRKRFNDQQIESLGRIQWWNWSDQDILAAVDLLSSANIQRFVEKFDVSSQGGGMEDPLS